MQLRFMSAYAAGFAIGLGSGCLSVRADEMQMNRPAQTAQAAHAPDCTCRAQGRNFAVGESACLRTATGPRLALCGMVLNNTSWQLTERPCPES